MSIIDLRYAKLGTREELNADNIVLAFMQPGIEKDTGDTKLGDGRTKYRDLAYFTGSLTRTYRGQVASESEMTALQANISDWCTRTDDGNRNYELVALPAKQADNWTSYISGTIENGVSSSDMDAAIQAAANDAKKRENGTGFDPAANVLVTLANGTQLPLQTYINTLEIRLTTLGSTAPSNSVQPTAPTGTLTVGSTLTAANGTWSGASTYNYVWYRVNTTTGTFTATGGTAATYIAQAADAGFKIAVSVAGVSAAGVIAAPVISALTASAIGATLPTISVNPAVTPSGSQVVGTLLTSTTGTWNNASGAVYTYQWTLDGAAISGATASTYTLIAGQEGKAVVCKVLATHPVQGPAAAAASSNTITVTGVPVFTNSAAPALTATVTTGTPVPITPATWSATPDASRTWRIYCTEGSGGLITPYAQITGTSATYNPNDDQFFKDQTGLPTIVGKTVSVDEVVTYLGVSYTSPKSTGKVVAAASLTLATTTDNTGMAWTQNSAISAVRPVSAIGGTDPKSYAITPATTALPAGLSLNPSTGQITGTPTVVSGSTTYSITVTDAAGATSTKTFTASVTAASAITTIVSINAKDAFSTMNGYVQRLGGSSTLSATDETNGITGSGTIVLPGVGASTMRFGKIADPLNSSRKVFVGASKNTDPSTYGHVGRVEVGPSTGVASLNKSGTTYWFAIEVYLPTSRFSAGAGNIMQIHQSDPAVDPFGPFALAFYNAGRIATNACVAVVYAPGSDAFVFPYYSDNSFNGNGAYPRDAWVKWVFKYRGDPTGTTGLLHAWKDGVAAYNLASMTNIRIGLNTPSYPNDYPKFLYDDFVSGGGAAGACNLVRSFHMIADNGSYTEPDIRALLV